VRAASHLGPIVRDATKVDWSQISIPTGIRNAVGVFLPLAIGAALGETAAGLTASIGALQLAFLDKPGGYRLRALRMVLATGCAALSVFVGCMSSGHLWLSLPAVILWAMAAGLVTSLGAIITQVGLTSVILLLVYGAFRLDPGTAAIHALLLIAGALFQTLLTVAAWPFARQAPERQALAKALVALASLATSDPEDEAAPPATSEMTTAATMLLGPGRSRTEESVTLRVLLDEAERVRLQLLSLRRAQLEANDAGEALGPFLTAASDVLLSVSQALRTGHPPVAADEAQARMDRAGDAVRASCDPPTWVRTGMRSLSAQLRACVELASGERGDRRAPRAAPHRLTTFGAWEILRANVNMRSASMRHAIRLATCLAVAEIVASQLGVGRSYWVPLTVAIVLKPDFASTFSRGVARILGTLGGLMVATVLVWAFFRSEADKVVLVGLLTLFIRTVGPANFGVSAVAITSLVVVFVSFAGAPPEQTIVERGWNTLLGGGIALAGYLAFPTWERTQVPAVLAELLEAYRAYAVAVFGLDDRADGQIGAPMYSLRLGARLARSNAEASVDRARSEPGGSDEALGWAERFLASSNRFANSVMALEAQSHEGSDHLSLAHVRPLGGAVVRTLDALAESLRRGSTPRQSDLPDLRAYDEVRSDTEVGSRQEESVVRIEAERMVNSLATMAHVLEERNRPTTTPSALARAASLLGRDART
jgi:uncharacterized membrane protein YccC